MNQTYFHLHLVSDGGEEGLAAAGQAMAKLYPHISAIEHIHAQVRTPDRLGEVTAAIEREPGIVLYRIADPEMAHRLERKCRALRCPSLSLLKLASRSSSDPNASYGEMISLHLKTRSRTAFRLAAMVFAVLLAAEALWILSADALRPRLASFPAGAAAAAVTPSERDKAQMAAKIGLVRGDLWADYAMTLVPQLPQEIVKGGPGAPARQAELARTAAERAASLAPHDSRIWLLLAAVASQLDRGGRQGDDALRMSYYTGPNELALIPTRLSIAARSSSIGDAELQVLVGQEIRTILTRKPDLKPWIVVAYRNASPEGRAFIESTVGALDPVLLATLRAALPAR
jgi:hypothetical protein